MGTDPGIITTASSFTSIMALLSITILVKVVATTYYNSYLHPLAKFPGPKFAAATPIPFAFYLVRGRLFGWVNSLHAHYGGIVRISPDELSFIEPPIWHDIFLSRPQLPKAALGGAKPANNVENIISAVSTEDHDRMRKILNPAFSDRALREQEYILQQYVNLMITRLQDRIQMANQKFIEVDIGDWFNFTTFDIIGDLCFGESFHSLENSEHHPWVSSIMVGVKFSYIVGAIDYFGSVRRPVKWVLSKLLSGKAQAHMSWNRDRIDKRIESSSSRPDFITHILSHNHQKGMTRDEIDANVALLVLAGSDTSATASCASTWFLLKNPSTMARLRKEINSAFRTIEDITIDSVSKLPYLHAVIQEAMRLHPAGALSNPRQVDRPGMIICDREIPIGTRVGIPQKVAYRYPQNFVEPLSFLPERWLENADPKFDRDKKNIYEPFLAGPRNCIGKSLGWAQVKLIVAKTLLSFDLELTSNNQEDWSDQKIWMIHHRAPLNVRLRNLAA